MPHLEQEARRHLALFGGEKNTPGNGSRQTNNDDNDNRGRQHRIMEFMSSNQRATPHTKRDEHSDKD